MKRLLVAFIILLNTAAFAATPAQVRIRVKLPFDSTSPSAVVLPVGTMVTVLWPQDDKLMVRYRRVEGLVPAVTINYVPSEHPGDIREFRPEPAAKDSDSPVVQVEHTTNTYHALTSAVASNNATSGSFPLNKVLGVAAVAVLVLIVASRDRKMNDDDGPQLRRHS
jgi:hypothetical protein